MKKIITITFAIMAVAVIICTAISPASAQFSKAVVILKGSVHSQQTTKAASVTISILSEDKSSEISSARSNSESGNYLVVLKTNMKYWIRVQGEGFTTIEEQIETPASQSTIQINKDFTVTESNETIDIARKVITR